MKKNFVKILLFITFLAISVVMLTACNGSKTQYTVTFNQNYTGAPAAKTVKVDAGNKVTATAEPSRERYAFGGWYKEAECKNIFDFASEKITKDVTLYAKWIQDYYYIAGNFTGYEAKLEGYNLLDVPGKEGWYYITVDLTQEVRDTQYDGHYYKITNGTWDTDGCWDIDNYGFQPAPLSPTGGGMGSIWIYDNCKLTVYFDSVNKVIYDNYEQTFAMPRIYGDFNTAMGRGSDWNIWDGKALTLADADKDGIYTGLYKIPAYTGTSENGYSMVVATKAKYDTEWFIYGVTEQFKFDGTAASMGGVSYLKPAADTVYEFSYNSTTHVTTITPYEAGQVVNFTNPIIYGDFGGWSIEGNSVINLIDQGDGKYVGIRKFSAYTGDGNGYMMVTALSKKLYDDQYGIRWGTETQYKFDGTVAGMNQTSFLKPTEETTYEFSYDSSTHITTVTVHEGEIKYTVTFNQNYTGAPDSSTVKVGTGNKTSPPSEPSREHHAFMGWFKDAECNNQFNFSTEEIIGDITLYAKWIQNYYYIAGSFTSYDAKLNGYNLLDVADKEGWYYITVNLTQELRDTQYDGHYYKITNGTWEASGCWDIDNYGFQPAPLSPTGGGMGSIWIYDNYELTVYFDSINKVIYDNYEQTFATPRIYGDFNAAMERGSNWSIEDDKALTLQDSDKDGIYTGLYKIPAYTGASENGYSMAIATKVKYDTKYFVYGVTEQFKFDGTAAGMGGVSYLKPATDTIYEFSYDSSTHVTTVSSYEAEQVVNFANPIIYGDFGGWSIEGNSVINLTDTDNDGIFVGFRKLPAYTGQGDGYMLITAISKKLYDDQYGIRWGAETQYKFDGTVPNMGECSYLKPESETIYEFSYDSVTHVTTVTIYQADEVVSLSGPTVYGDFTSWIYEGGNAFVLTDADEDGIFTGTMTLEAYTGEGEGYMVAVALSKKLYDDQWGIRWGIQEQYKFDGEAAGMGNISYIKPTEQTMYLFSYDSVTHVTTVTEAN